MSVSLDPLQKPASPSPIELVERLATHQKRDLSDPVSYMVFKESKRSLKELAKRGELPEELRTRVISILSQRGFRYSAKDTRFRGYGVSSAEILFNSPKLWHVLYCPESFPTESALVDSLNDDAFRELLNLRRIKNVCISIENFVELHRVITLLNIPELEKIYKELLFSRIETSQPILNIRTLYQLATIWPANKEPLFSQQLAAQPRRFRDTLPESFSSEQVAAEFDRFNRMIAGSFAAEKANLSLQTLYRFFLFVHNEGKTASPLHVELFGLLLDRLKSGELEASHCKDLVKFAEESFELNQRMKQDSIQVELQGIGCFPVSIWPLFAESDYIRTLLMSGMNTEKVILEGHIAKTFFLLYDLWIKGREIEIGSLSLDLLIGILQGADYFGARDFDKTKDEIAYAIIKNCDDTPGTIAALAEIVCSTSCQELEDHVIFWLKKNPIFSIKKEGQQYSVAISMKELPPFASLQSGLRVLKILKDNDRLSKVELRVNEESQPGLMLLCGVCCCCELGLTKEKEELEEKLVGLERLEKSWHDELKGWSPFDVVFLLNRCSDSVSTHLLKQLNSEYFGNQFWKYARDYTKGESSTSLKEEAAAFERMASDQTGKEVLGLSAKALPHFLHFLLQQDIPLEECPDLLKTLSMMISERIKEKTVNVELLKKSLEDCRVFFPEKAHSISTLRVGVEYGATILQLPLHLLLKMESCRQILTDGKMGSEFETIPIDSAAWAIELLEKVLSKNKAPLISEEEARSLPAAHFLALQQLQKGIFNDEHEPMKTRAAELRSLAPLFPEETLLTAASWALSVGCDSFFNKCSSRYCGKKMVKFEQNRYSSQVRLSSFQPRPLRLLKAVGADCSRLHIDVETDADGVENPWMQVAQACPNLHHLTLYLNSKVSSLESLPLAALKRLEWLTICPRDKSAWQGLRGLKIPTTIRRTYLFVDMQYLEEAPAFEFLRNLPPKGVLLNLNVEALEKEAEQAGILASLWSSYVAADPVASLFSNLTHCKTLEIDAKKKDCLKYIVSSNHQLEELTLEYQDNCPNVSDIQSLVDPAPGSDFRPMMEMASDSEREMLQVFQGPHLKKCQIKIYLHGASKAREGMRDYLNRLAGLKRCGLRISLDGSYDKELDRIIKDFQEEPKNKDQPQVSIRIVFF